MVWKTEDSETETGVFSQHTRALDWTGIILAAVNGPLIIAVDSEYDTVKTRIIGPHASMLT